MPEPKKTKPAYSMGACLRFLIGRGWRYRRRVPILCALQALLQTAQRLCQLLVAPVILSQVERAAPLSALLSAIALFTLALALLGGAVRYVQENADISMNAVRSKILMEINEKALCTSYVNTLQEPYRNQLQKASEAVMNNTSAAEDAWRTLTRLLTASLGFASYLFLLRGLHPVLLGVILLTTALSFWAARRANAWHYAHREEADVPSRRLRTLSGLSRSTRLAKDIRIFGLRPWIGELMDGLDALVQAYRDRRDRVILRARALDVALTFLRNGLAYFFLIRMTLQKGLPASQFLLSFTAATGFTGWVMDLLNGFAQLHSQCLDLSGILEFLNYPEPFLFEEGAPVPPSETWELKLEHVSFRYPGAQADTIRGVDLTLHPGEKVALVGLNGAGKTTLVKLLCGFLDPTEGRVLLNGQDVRALDRQAYYALFSAVFQEHFLLDVTVAQTVAQSVGEIDRDKVAWCLGQAGLWEAVEALPQGMDTHVGREVFLDGVLFSGGQTQRLMLARALYKDGPFLVLDEPTAALDPLAENDLYLKYSDLARGKTSLFISHRLASTRFCDRILFLRDGQIAEEGTHEALLAQKGGYADLFEVQSRYYREGRDF